MITKEKSISLFLETFVPKHISDSESNLINILKSYYDWCESENNVHNVMHTFGETFNDDFILKYYDMLRKEYFPSFPEFVFIDKDVFLKNAREVFASKGTEASISFFFKALFNDNARVIYPAKRNKLAHERKKIFLCHVSRNLTYSKYEKFLNLVGKHICHLNGALAYVESIQLKTDKVYDGGKFVKGSTYSIPGYSYVYIEISNKHFGEFTSRVFNGNLGVENLSTPAYNLVYECDEFGNIKKNSSGNVLPSVFRFSIENMLCNVKILNNGVSYSVGDILQINSPGTTTYGNPIFKRCKAVVGKVSAGGGIEQVIFSDPGAGYDETNYYAETNIIEKTISITTVTTTGSITTIKFNQQTTIPYPVGSTILVNGGNPSSIDGTYTVTAATKNSVSYPNTSAPQIETPSVGTVSLLRGGGSVVFFTPSAEYDENQNIIYDLEQNTDLKYTLSSSVHVSLYKDLFLLLAHPAAVEFESTVSNISFAATPLYRS